MPLPSVSPFCLCVKEKPLAYQLVPGELGLSGCTSVARTRCTVSTGSSTVKIAGLQGET